MPDERLAEPWTMSAEEQQAAGCVIGRDYPAPIVDHAAERRLAIERFRPPAAAATGALEGRPAVLLSLPCGDLRYLARAMRVPFPPPSARSSRAGTGRSSTPPHGDPARGPGLGQADPGTARDARA